MHVSIQTVVKFMVSPIGLLVVVVVLALSGRFVMGMKYLDCSAIIKNHYECYKKENGKYKLFPVVLYTIIPVIISFALAQVEGLDGEKINIITIIISILTAMFFTLLALIIDMKEKIRNNKNYLASDANVSIKLLREVYYSLMFEIFLSILTLLMCFLVMFKDSFGKINTVILYYFLFDILINLFIVLKRIFLVIEREIEK